MRTVRCPGCQMLLMEAETTSGVCPLCKKPLTPAAAGSAAWLRRTPVIVVLALITPIIIWLALRTPGNVEPEVAAVPEQPQMEKTEPTVKPSESGPKDSKAIEAAAEVPPAVDKEKDDGTRTKPAEILPSGAVPRPLASLPDKVYDANKQKVIEKLDIGTAVIFVSKVLRANNIVAQRYFRELDQADLGIWAVRGIYDAVKEPVPAVLEQYMEKNRALIAESPSALLMEARLTLGKRPEVEDHKDVEAALKFILRQLDAHSALLSARDMERIRTLQSNASLAEIGVNWRLRPKAGIEVRAAYKDGPAYRVGIKPGDVITHFTLQEPGNPDFKVLPVADASEDAVEQIIWGPMHSQVALTVQRPGAANPLEFVVTRDLVKKEKVLGFERRSDDSWNHVIDRERGFYYVRLVDFHERSSVDQLEYLLTTEKEKIQGLILDLRFAGGGLVDTTVRIADLFIDSGLIVEFRWRADGSGPTLGKRRGSHLHFPMACLVDATSAACTEMVAACLQDHRRAAIVGERTTGKSSVQNYFAFEQFTLRLTTSNAFRPSGKALSPKLSDTQPEDEWGVKPDGRYLISLSKDERAALREHLASLLIPYRDLPDAAVEFEDRQLDSALDYLRRKSDGEFVFP